MQSNPTLRYKVRLFGTLKLLLFLRTSQQLSVMRHKCRNTPHPLKNQGSSMKSLEFYQYRYCAYPWRHNFECNLTQPYDTRWKLCAKLMSGHQSLLTLRLPLALQLPMQSNPTLRNKVKTMREANVRSLKFACLYYHDWAQYAIVGCKQKILDLNVSKGCSKS